MKFIVDKNKYAQENKVINEILNLDKKLPDYVFKNLIIFDFDDI